MRHARMLVALLVLGPLLPDSARAADLSPEPFLDGLSFPTNMAFLPDGAMLYTEKETGSVRVVSPDGALLERPFVTLPVIPDAERGLLGIAVHPDFDREPWVYLYRSDPADGRNRLVRVRADGAVAAGAPETLFDGLSAAAGYHNGGDLVFGTDGTLFVSLGEAHDADRAQDEDDIGGTIVRLEPDGSVPPDNPFGPENPVWSIGHRNSFGLCVDPRRGDLWETENGPDRDDEVNLVEAGANYGWPLVTGRGGDERFVDPVAVFPEPVALTGCAVVGGDLWFGSYDGRLWRLPAGSTEPEEAATFRAGVTDVALGPDGLLFVATADEIATIAVASEASNVPTPGRSPGQGASQQGREAGDEPDAWRDWIVAAALVVLAGALGARFVAGRRLHREPPTGER